MPRRGCKEGISYVELDEKVELDIDQMDEFDRFMKSHMQGGGGAVSRRHYNNK